MKGFKFQLQSLLNIKEKQEEQRETELGKAVSKLEEEKRQLVHFDIRRQEIIDMQREKALNVVNPMEISNLNHFLVKLQADKEKQENVVQQQEQEVELCRKALIEVTMEKKAYEKLREKALEKFKKEQLMKEQKMLDEIVTIKSFKKREDK